MKLLTTLLLLQFNLLPYAIAQYNNLKPGAYRNAIAFQNGDVLYSSKFEFKIKHLNKAIPLLYKVKTESKDISRRNLKFGIWGIYQDDCLYLNIKRLNMAKGFVKLGKPKKYMYFEGKPIKSLNQTGRTIDAAVSFGLLGFTTAETMNALQNMGKVHYIINLETGTINLLSASYLKHILKDFPSLELDFIQETNTNDRFLLMEYVNKINNEIKGITAKQHD